MRHGEFTSFKGKPDYPGRDFASDAINSDAWARCRKAGCFQIQVGPKNHRGSLQAEAEERGSIEVTKEITTGEAHRLTMLEGTIQRGLKTFIEVGEALCEIRDSRLYRKEFDSFEAYCQQKWQMSRFKAHRLIGAAKVSKKLLPMGNTPKPKTERQVRPLTKVEPERQPEVWQAAVNIAGGNQPTTKQVEQAVKESIAPVIELAGAQEMETAAVLVSEPKSNSASAEAEGEDEDEREPERPFITPGLSAVDYWDSARDQLEEIKAEDESRESILKEIITYCLTRIQTKK